MNPETSIDILVRAAYPIVYIVSHEEKRVENALREIAKTRTKEFMTWSCTRGIVEHDGTPHGDALTNPLSALEFVEGHGRPALFAFMDLHPFMNDSGDPSVSRKLRELSDALKTDKKTLFIVSSTLELPPELEKQITVFDWPLPREEEIGQLLDDIVKRMGFRGLNLEFSSEAREKILKSCLGMTEGEIDNVLAKSLVTHKDISLDTIISEKAQIIRKSGVLEFFPIEENFNNVGGLDNLRRWLEKRGNAFTERARAFNLPQPKGVLLLGVQGCGKSLICKALASLWQMPLLRFDIGKMFAGIVGKTGENIRRAIQTAEAISPCVFWIDEMEKGFAGSRSSGITDGGVSARALSTFLTWQQEKTLPVFTIATCNSINQLPPELLRKGRFDEIFFVDLPRKTEREDIFKIHLLKRNRDPRHFDLNSLARATSEFSGAEIENVVEAGMFDAFDEGCEIETEHILKAISTTVPLAKTAKEEIEGLRKWAVNRARFASNHITEPIEQGERDIDLDLEVN